tara:strand:- start:489 stop:605 length:117 start_codon:yes stop_codon:yes gene_type:complete
VPERIRLSFSTSLACIEAVMVKNYTVGKNEQTERRALA